MTTAQSPFRTLGASERLVERVVGELERLIIEGELPTGTKLPPEREFAEQLGVSRTVLREAVRMLASRGLLETRHGVGTVVRQIGHEHVVNPLHMWLRTQTGGEVSFDDLHHVRTLLEVDIAKVAAQHATDEDVTKLAAILTLMEESEDDPIGLAEHDSDFHATLAEMTHNPVLAVMLNSIRDILQSYIKRVNPYLDPAQDVLPFHYPILDAIAKRDPQAAATAMRTHQMQMCRNHAKALALSKGLNLSEEGAYDACAD